MASSFKSYVQMCREVAVQMASRNGEVEIIILNENVILTEEVVEELVVVWHAAQRWPAFGTA